MEEFGEHYVVLGIELELAVSKAMSYSLYSLQVPQSLGEVTPSGVQGLLLVELGDNMKCWEQT